MHRLLAAVTLVGLVSTGCDRNTKPLATVETVTIAPAIDSTVVGGTTHLTATAKDDGGETLDDRSTTWSSSNEAVASVSSTGLVTGVAPGTVQITATVEGKDALAAIQIKDGGVVGPTGATLSVQGGSVALTVPAGALAQPTPIGVEPATDAPSDSRVIGGTAFTFTPEGTEFATPASLSIGYAPSAITGEENALRLYKASSGGWQEVPGSIVDTAAHTVSGSIGGFSTYAVLGASVTSAGRLVYHDHFPAGEDLFTIEPDGTGAVQLNLDPAIRSGEIDDPAWSPGHTRIAFSAKPPAPNNAEYDIFVVNPDGSGLVDLTNTPTENEYTPAWSPDGTRIAFVREGIWIMNADGSSPIQISGVDAEASGLDWSPAGDKLSFASEDNIFVIAPDGTGLAPLTTYGGGTRAHDARWSPDGTHLVFTVFDGSSNRTYIANADGSNPAPLLGPAFRDLTNPVWSPDGTRIAFHAVLSAGEDLYAVNVDGSGLTAMGIPAEEDFAWR
jgi:WD40 repeat protein